MKRRKDEKGKTCFLGSNYSHSNLFIPLQHMQKRNEE